MITAQNKGCSTCYRERKYLKQTFLITRLPNSCMLAISKRNADIFSITDKSKKTTLSKNWGKYVGIFRNIEKSGGIT